MLFNKLEGNGNKRCLDLHYVVAGKTKAFQKRKSKVLELCVKLFTIILYCNKVPQRTSLSYEGMTTLHDTFYIG